MTRSANNKFVARAKKLRVPEVMRFQFSESELDSLKRTFAFYDVDGSGAIDRDELAAVLREFGQDDSDARLVSIFKEVSAPQGYNMINPRAISSSMRSF